MEQMTQANEQQLEQKKLLKNYPKPFGFIN